MMSYCSEKFLINDNKNKTTSLLKENKTLQQKITLRTHSFKLSVNINLRKQMESLTLKVMR